MTTQSPERHIPGRMLTWILNHATLTLFGLAIVTIALGGQIPRLRFKTSIYDLVIEELPESRRYREYKQLFGCDEIIRVVVKADAIFDPLTFAAIQQLTRETARITGVRRVISLDTIRHSVDPGGKFTLEQFRQILAPATFFQRNLVSADDKTTALTLLLAAKANKAEVLAAVDHLIGTLPADLRSYQVGMPLVSRALAAHTRIDFLRLPPITVGLMAILLWAVYRRPAGVILPLACVAISLIWTFGAMALLQIPLSLLTMIVPVFLIAVCSAYCLHIVSTYFRLAARGLPQAAAGPPAATFATPVATPAATAGCQPDLPESQPELAPEHRATVYRCFNQMGLPTVIAVATTIIGLGSLALNRITAIREFAIFACGGMVAFVVVIFTLLPALLSFLRPTTAPTSTPPSTLSSKGLMDRFLEMIVRINLRHQKIALPVLGGLALVGVMGIFQLRVETNPLSFFKPDSAIRHQFSDIYRDLSGSFPVNVMVSGPGPDYFESAEHLVEIAEVQRYLDNLPGVDKTLSVVDYVKLVHYAMSRFDPAAYILPTEDYQIRRVFNNFRSVLGDETFGRVLSPDYARTNILMFTHLAGTQAFLDTRTKILAYVGRHLPARLNWDVTGFGIVVSASSHLITGGQIKSLSLTLVLVFGVMYALFLSCKVGAIAIVPNLFPIVVNFGLMGWLGIELSVFTSLIASIAIGLAVDDTIHYTVHYYRELKQDLDAERALARAIHDVGRPITATTLAIGIGFSILMLSAFKPTAIFGLMMMITMSSALLADLILLPALLQHVELVTLWDLVRLKLGQDPRRGIPLFKGLSRTQAHYILMAGTIKTVAAGELLFRKGDPSDSMYALVSGRVEVIDYETGNGRGDACAHKVLAELKTGDVVGEMGLIRAAARSATVVASQPVELLEINWTMIRRLQWLYPPTARRFFFNLMGILSDRLEKTNRRLTRESRLDEYSGLPNERSFERLLDRETERVRRYGGTLTVAALTVTIDKPFLPQPDDRAHRVAELIGEVFIRGIRKTDAVGHLRQLTFIIALPQKTGTAAATVIDRLIKSAQAACVETIGLAVAIEKRVAIYDPECDGGGRSFMGRVLADYRTPDPVSDHTTSRPTGQA